MASPGAKAVVERSRELGVTPSTVLQELIQVTGLETGGQVLEALTTGVEVSPEGWLLPIKGGFEFTGERPQGDPRLSFFVYDREIPGSCHDSDKQLGFRD